MTRIWTVLTALFFSSQGFGSEELSFASVKRLLEKHSQITTIDALLAKISPAGRSQYLLVHNSLSLQSSTTAAPRVLLVSDDAKFIMTFNSHDAQRGANALEFMEFEPATNTFGFYSIKFPENDPTAPVEYSERNPRLCTTCHRQQAKPNWDSYPVWPHVYGSSWGAERIDGLDESAALTTMKLLQRDAPRYRHLVGLSKNELVDYKRENLNFTQRMNHLNFQRIAKQLIDSPDYEKYRYAIYGTVSHFGCKPENLLPENPRRMLTKTYADLLAEAEANAENLAAKQNQISSHVNTADLFQAPIVAGVRYLMEGRALTIEDWALPLDRNTFSFADGTIGLKGLASALAAQDSQLYRYRGCDELRDASTAAFAKN